MKKKESKEPIDIVADRLAQIEAANGRLTPEAVVEDAKAKSSPLHELFDWDTDRAAHAHWLECAREIIRSVRYEYSTETLTIKVPKYVRDPQVDIGEQGYVTVASLQSDTVSAKAALRYEFGRAEAYLHRAREIAVALNLEGHVDRILGRLKAVRDKAAA